jgi:hypothetical protein
MDQSQRRKEGMATYRNLCFDEACDVLKERGRRLESQIVERERDLGFEPAAASESAAPTLAARLLGQRITVEPATTEGLVRAVGLGHQAAALPQALLAQALNHVTHRSLGEAGGVQVWYDSDGRLLHLDWGYRQRTRMDSLQLFRTAFTAINMRNQHAVRRPRVLSLSDLPTSIEATADCDKVRDIVPGDPSYGSIMLRHSEMGAIRSSLSATVWRAVCSNVMVFGPSESYITYVGTERIALGLNEVVGDIASRLGGLLNRMRRLRRIPCMPMALGVPVIQFRWDLAKATADALLNADSNLPFDYMGSSDGCCLYHVLNCLTAVTTHRRTKIPQRDRSVLSGLSDSLLIQGSPLQQVLQEDLRAGVTRGSREDATSWHLARAEDMSENAWA